MFSAFGTLGLVPSRQRRAWPPEGLARLAVDADGVICHGNTAARHLFGYRTRELLGKHVSLLLPKLAATELFGGDQFNSRLAYLCRCGPVFEGVRHDGLRFDCELFLNVLGPVHARTLALLVR